MTQLTASKRFGRIARNYQKMAVVPQEINRRLLAHLDYMRLQPEVILELGAATGYGMKLLRQRYPAATIVAVDSTQVMLTTLRKKAGWFRRPMTVCADIVSLPFLPQSVDLIVANLTLNYCANLADLLVDMRRLLKPDGLLVFSLLGVDSFKEFKQAWAAVDSQQHVENFVDMHDIGDLLVQAKFLDPVMEMEHLTLTYSNLTALWQELKNTGATYCVKDVAKGLLGKSKFKQFLLAYEKFKQADGRYPLTLEIIYGHAWGNSITADAVLNESGEVMIPFAPIPINKKT